MRRSFQVRVTSHAAVMSRAGQHAIAQLRVAPRFCDPSGDRAGLGTAFA